MKDQASVDGGESKKEKYDRAVSLFLESLYKPDNDLRACGHNQKCYNEMMEIRETVIQYVTKDLRIRGFHNKGPMK
jgi:hypothetical protein|tara:strand:- start:2406 stop:2633 length:228 start_codon:yes stop_codon:yes gene_type:complete